MKKFKLIPFSILLLFSGIIFSQQIVKGKIVDKESKFPLPGVSVAIISVDPVMGTTTDANGNFKLTDVPVGRQSIKVSFIGYAPIVQTIIINSGRESIVNLELEESTELLEEFTVTSEETHDVNNEMALVSSRQFSVEETERYAGSRGDPARMASNFAGVNGTDDSRNDIVVRGNSPLGVVYRVEGIDIPNPNHFAISGSTGGPVSILNNKFLANSDFFTGAFPAEYGNSTSGIFDLKLRSGNNEKHEFTGQFGFLGTEALAEGPLSKNHRSSYLIMYRYSTVSLFNSLGINIGTNAVPKYQDMSFKLNFPLSKGGNLAVWAISGKSNIDILISNQTDTSEVDLYGDNDRDQYFGTGMAVGGVTYTKPLNEDTYFKTTVSQSIAHQHAKHNYVVRHIDAEGGFILDSTYDYMRFRFNNFKTSNSAFINRKFGKKDVIKIGYNVDVIHSSLHDSIIENVETNKWKVRWNTEQTFGLIQPYIQWKHKFSDRLTISAGIHNQYFTLNNSSSWLEPRFGLKWQVNENDVLTFGIGKHSQIQPYYTYFYIVDNDTTKSDGFKNTQMGMTKSNQIVLGYSKKLGKSMQAKVETYYQQLYNIPVSQSPSSYSLINAGGGFSRLFPDSLVNEGTGYNYGVEMTLDRYFSKSWYFMLSGSLYNSRYEGSDGIERNTSFNGKFAANLLIGKEFKVGERKTLGLGGKVTIAGGRRYGIVDTTASNELRELIYLDQGYNYYQFRNYFRADAKISFKHNAKKVTHEIAVDLVNFLNRKNILSLSYAPKPGDPSASPIRENYQLGFLPIFYYRIDF